MGATLSIQALGAETHGLASQLQCRLQDWCDACRRGPGHLSLHSRRALLCFLATDISNTPLAKSSCEDTACTGCTCRPFLVRPRLLFSHQQHARSRAAGHEGAFSPMKAWRTCQGLIQLVDRAPPSKNPSSVQTDLWIRPFGRHKDAVIGTA